MYIGTIRLGDFPIPAGSGTAGAGLGRIGQPAAITCAPEPGEIAKSHTPAGIRPKDVTIDNKSVLVSDFGVGDRSVKQSAKVELAPVLERLENDPRVKTIKITGFDDCLKATPQDHRYLRQQRALHVRALLGPKARAKVVFAGGAPLDTFVGPNYSPGYRARNRSVRVEVEIAPEYLPSFQGTDCKKKLMEYALAYLKAEWLMDETIKPRLALAIQNSLAKPDDSFLTSSAPNGIDWSNVNKHFHPLCNQMMASPPPKTAKLKQRLIDLDKQLRSAKQLLRDGLLVATRSNVPDAVRRFEAKFTNRYNALLQHKSNTAYAEY